MWRLLALLQTGYQSLRASSLMAANIESRPNEKDASLQSSVAGAGGQTHAARNLDERRRSALAHIDNASFSSVKKKKLLFFTLMAHVHYRF